MGTVTSFKEAQKFAQKPVRDKSWSGTHAQQFAKDTLTEIVSDAKYKDRFFNEDGSKRDDYDRITLELHERLQSEYKGVLDDYHSGLPKRATFYRHAAGALDLIGDALYFPTLGAGAGFKALALAPKLALVSAEADYLHDYMKDHDISNVDKWVADTKATTEAVATGVGSALVLGVGLVDWYRGRDRWKNAAEGALRNTLGKNIKYNAIDAILTTEKAGRIIKLDDLRNPAYSKVA